MNKISGYNEQLSIVTHTRCVFAQQAAAVGSLSPVSARQ